MLPKLDRPFRAADHEMWVLYGPLRPAHEAAHVFSRAGDVVYYCYYYYYYDDDDDDDDDDDHRAHEAAHAF